ncbi:hypothetical protein [Streptomyces paludis]|uniref:Uncharacterized protein n=1 Tax=Streptomyces paludis TaxID=2282738 RepID=A0A345HXX6_9ACTN|nr:hypothetical protein [Streptomyces paludis]AXG81550.1 hypothetical protein DVK44_31880 [Streptomyces paludis]
MTEDQSRTAAYQASASGLARRALGALSGSGGTAMVAEHVESAADPGAALAAVRILGADALAPALLTGAVLHTGDAEAIALSFSALPPPAEVVPAPPGGPEAAWLMAWRDWATVSLLAVLTGRHTDGVHAPRPEPPAARAAEDAARGADRTGGAGGAGSAVRTDGAGGAGDAGGAGGAEWAVWSVRMGQLCTLALPGLDGPVHDAARGAPLGLARGAARAVLRRDYATAARIARWLAWLRADGAELPLDPGPMVEHIALMAGGDRPALDAAIARRLLIA